MENKNTDPRILSSVGDPLSSEFPVVPEPTFDPQALTLQPTRTPAQKHSALQHVTSSMPRWGWRIVGAFIAVLLLAVVGWIVLRSNEQTADLRSVNPSESFDTTTLSLKELELVVELPTAKQVAINGLLTVNGSLVVSPSLQPATTKPGQLYYDQATNELAYYNGAKFVVLRDQVVQSIGGVNGQVALGGGLGVVDGQLSNNGVLSLGGQAGTITLGNGLVMGGNVLQNNGVVSLVAGSGISVTNNGSGSFTVANVGAGSGTVTSSGGGAGAIPVFTAAQNIEDSIISQSGLTVTVAGSLNLGNALSVSNGGTGAASLAANGIIVGNGAGALSSITAGGAGLCLLSTAGAPNWAACPSGTGDDISVNGAAAANANFLDTAASGTNAAITWSLNGASTPDDITLSVGNASATAAGTVTTGVQTFAGAKTFNGQITAGAGVSLGTQTLSGAAAVIDFTNFDVSSAGALTAVGVNAGGGLLQGTGGLTVGGTVTLSDLANGFLEVNGSGVVSVGTINLTTDTVGDYVANLGALTGLSIVGNSGEGSTPSLSVLYGSSSNTAVQGNTGITVTAGTNLTGGGSITLGAGGSVTLNVASSPTFSGDVVIQGGDVTLGTATGAGTLLMHDGDGETLTLALPDVSASYVLTMPTAVGSANQCLKAQNGTGALFWDDCTGGAGGGLSGSGTLNRVSKFTPNGTTLGDSSISDDGSLVTLNGNVNLSVQGTTVTVGVGSSRTGSIVLQNSTNNNTVTLQSGVTGGSYALTLPTAVGSANQCLKAQNGTGTLFWDDCLGGSGTTPTLQQVYDNDANGGNAVVTLTSSDGAILIRDNATPLGGTLFAIQDSGGTASYLNVAAASVTIGDAGANTAIALNSGTGTIDIGTGAQSRTINLGTGAAVVQNINIGGTGANVIAIGDTQTSGSISLGAALTNGTINIGGTGANTGAIAIGNGTGNQTIGIGNGNSGTKTINIGPVTGGTSTVNIAVANTANDVHINDNSSNGTVTIGGANSRIVTTMGSSTIDIGVNQNNNTINIGDATIVSSHTQTVDIATNTTGTGRAVITIGNTNGTSSLALQAGSGGIALNGSSTLSSGSNLTFTDGRYMQTYSGTSDGATMTQTSTSGTQTNGLLVNRNGGGGTTTNGINITQTAGTLTNGLAFTGTIGTDINRGTGTLSLNGASGITLAAGGSTKATVGATDVTLATDIDLLLQGANAIISNSQAQSNSEAFGLAANVGGSDALAVGNGADASSSNAIALGRAAWAQENRSIALGVSAHANGIGSIALGYNADVQHADSIALGEDATTTAANQFVIGSNSQSISSVIIGNGVTNTTPVGFRLQATGGSGANVAGANLDIAAGQSTGSAGGGNIAFLVSPAGGAGSGVNSAVTVATIQGGTGAANFQNATNSTQAFNIENASGGNLFTVDTSNSRVGIGLGGNNTPVLNNQGLEVNGAIRISGSANDNYTTPDGATITARLSVVNSTVGGSSQIIAVGLDSASDATARGITVADDRAGAHQPSIAVLSPNEAQVGGFSWDGSDTAFLIKNTASGSIGLNVNGTTSLSATASGVDVPGSLTVQGTNALTLGATGTNTGAALFKGSTAASGTLTLIGQNNPGNHTITLPNETGVVCTTGSVCSGYAPASGSANYIQNGTALQSSANFYVQSAATTSVTANFRALASQTANVIQIRDSSDSVTVFAVSPGGAITTPSTINGNSFSSNALQFGAAATASISPAASQALTITANATSTWSTSSGNLSLQAAGTLNIGNGGGAAINIGTNAAAHTIQMGNSANDNDITIGSTNTSSTLNLQAGTSGMNFTLNGASRFVFANTSGGEEPVVRISETTSNETPTLELYGNAGGDTEMYGQIRFTMSANDANVANIKAIRMNNSSAGELSFEVAPNSGGPVEALRINRLGNITAKPNTDATAAFQVQNAAGTNILTVDSTIQQVHVRNQTDNASFGSNIFSASCTGTNWSGTNPYNTTGFSSAPLTCTTPTVTAGTTYEITFTIANNDQTDNPVTPSIGGVDGVPVGTNTAGIVQVITASTTGSLTFTPHFNFDGDLTITSVRAVTNSTSALAVRNSSNTTTLTVRAPGTNIGIGLNSLQSNVSGTGNVALGNTALRANTVGSDNVAIGESLQANTDGEGNVAIGKALGANLGGLYNVALGYDSMYSNLFGSFNVALGINSLGDSVVGDNNIALGTNSLGNSSDDPGSRNVAIGYNAGAVDDEGSGGFWFQSGSLNDTVSLGTGAISHQSNSIILGRVGDGTTSLTTGQARVGIGTTAPDNMLSVSQVFYDTGTAEQSGNTITGTGTTWTSAVVGMRFIFADGTDAGTITARNSNTSLTVNTSQTVSSGNSYRIHNVGFQVATSGNAWHQATSTTAFRVLNAAAVPHFVVDTTNSRVYIGNPTGDTTGALLVLDTKTDSGDPTGVDGAMYYNSDMAAMRCYYDGVWRFCNDPRSLAWGYNFAEDFLSNPASGIGVHNWNSNSSGSGAAVAGQDPDVSSRPGQIQLSTGTTSTGFSNMYHTTAGGTGEWTLIAGGEELEFAINIPNLADGTNDYDLRIGLCDTAGTDCTDGIYFEYDRDTSTNWRYATAAGGSRTKNSSTKAVATGWITFKVVVNSNASSVAFYVRNAADSSWTNLGSNTTNIPTAGTEPGFTIQKEAGTTARTIRVDYFHLRSRLSSVR